MALFETLKHMSANDMDIARFDDVHAADANTKMGKITMRTTPQAVYQLGGIVGKQTHIPILFMVNAEQYAEVEKLLAEDPQPTPMPNTNPNPVQSKSQSQMILSYLQDGNKVTQLDAYDRFSCTRLGARCWELKQQGHPIQREMITVPSGKRVAQYSIRKEA